MKRILITAAAIIAAALSANAQQVDTIKISNITTMSCLEANGAMHTYLVQFEEYPKQLVIEAGKSVKSEETATLAAPAIQNRNTALEDALKQPKSLYHIGSKGYGISIFCDNVFIKDDIMYVVLNIENKSATTYSLSEPRFSIESKKRTKRGLVYEKQIFPKNILGMEPIAPNTQTRMVFSFDKISVLQGQVFRTYLYESGGTRNYVITFSEKDVILLPS